MHLIQEISHFRPFYTLIVLHGEFALLVPNLSKSETWTKILCQLMALIFDWGPALLTGQLQIYIITVLASTTAAILLTILFTPYTIMPLHFF